MLAGEASPAWRRSWAEKELVRSRGLVVWHGEGDCPGWHRVGTVPAGLGARWGQVSALAVLWTL